MLVLIKNCEYEYFSRVDGGVEDDNNTPTPAEFIKFETLDIISYLFLYICLDTSSAGCVTTLM